MWTPAEVPNNEIHLANDGVISGGNFVEDTVNPGKPAFILDSYTVILLVIVLEFTTSEP